MGLAVEFPVKWGFGGESRAICRRFAPPKGFGGESPNTNKQKKLYQSQKILFWF